jgi:hypothetical protein
MFEPLRAAALLGLLAGSTAVCLSAQVTNPQMPAPGQQTEQPSGGAHATSEGGVNTGPAHPAQYDEQRRPITAGGFVKSGPVIFDDISQKAGVTHWSHKMGSPEKKYIIETNGSGVGLIDYDNDGWLDIYDVRCAGWHGDAASCSALPQ